MARTALLVDTLRDIDADPSGWHQGSWRECFAARAAILAGGEWATDATSNLSFLLKPVEGDPAADVRNYGHHGSPLRAVNVTTRAARLLRLTKEQADRLFLATNTLHTLHVIVSDLCEVAA